MGLKLFSPEFAATGCARKLLATRSNSAELERFAHIDDVEWSLTHTILVDMGGIALRFPPKPEGRTADTAESIAGSEVVSRPAPVPESASPPKSVPGIEFIDKFRSRQDTILGWCGDIPWNLYPPHVELARQMAEHDEDKSLIGNNVAALAGDIWILDSNQLAIARRRGIITKMPKIEEQQIEDKSKSDGLVKLIAILQVLWLVVQLIARTIQNLPFTQLEITTVAFAATAVIIYGIDFLKPKDVKVPFYENASRDVKYDDFVEIIKAAPFAYVQSKRYYMPTSTLHDIIDYSKINSDPEERYKEECKKECELCKKCGRCKWCKTPGEPAGQSAEPAGRSAEQAVCVCNTSNTSPRKADICSLLVGFFSATSFGGVHLFAWNNQFPTEVEKLLWRISALMTIILPYIYICTHLPFIGKPLKDIGERTRLGMRIGLLCIAVCYVPCRLFLLTESFRSLYYLPPGAFISTWAGNFPHLG